MLFLKLFSKIFGSFFKKKSSTQDITKQKSVKLKLAIKQPKQSISAKNKTNSQYNQHSNDILKLGQKQSYFQKIFGRFFKKKSSAQAHIKPKPVIKRDIDNNIFSTPVSTLPNNQHYNQNTVNGTNEANEIKINEIPRSNEIKETDKTKHSHNDAASLQKPLHSQTTKHQTNSKYDHNSLQSQLNTTNPQHALNNNIHTRPEIPSVSPDISILKYNSDYPNNQHQGNNQKQDIIDDLEYSFSDTIKELPPFDIESRIAQIKYFYDGVDTADCTVNKTTNFAKLQEEFTKYYGQKNKNNIQTNIETNIDGTHDYIQIMFPGRAPGMFNKKFYFPKSEDWKKLEDATGLMKDGKLYKAVVAYARHIGFDLAYNEPDKDQHDEEFRKGHDCIYNNIFGIGKDHNMLRICRVLNCVFELSKTDDSKNCQRTLEVAQEFYNRMRKIYDSYKNPSEGLETSMEKYYKPVAENIKQRLNVLSPSCNDIHKSGHFDNRYKKSIIE